MKQRLCSDTAVILLYKNASILQWHHHAKNDTLVNNSSMYILYKTLRFHNKFDQDLRKQGFSFGNNTHKHQKFGFLLFEGDIYWTRAQSLYYRIQSGKPSL